MKKKLFGGLLVMTVVLAAGCGSAASFTIQSDVNANKVTVTTKEAGDDGGSGYITINDGQILNVDAAVEKGAYEVIIAKDTDESEDFVDINDVAESDIIMDIEIDKDCSEAKELPAGDYVVGVKTDAKTTGNLTISAAEQ